MVICDDSWEKGMIQDVDVKIQVRSYLNFDVDVLNHAFSPWIITFILGLSDSCIFF